MDRTQNQDLISFTRRIVIQRDAAVGLGCSENKPGTDLSDITTRVDSNKIKFLFHIIARTSIGYTIATTRNDDTYTKKQNGYEMVM